jgi:hypothetical protein
LSPPTINEEVVVYGLVARPEFNGRIGIISGVEAEGRYPVKVAGHPRVITIKPNNFHRLGVNSADRPGKARKFECSLHRSEVCSQCSLDFGIANHLSKIHFSNGPAQLSRDSIEQIAETHFAIIEAPDGDVESKFLVKDFPMECQGLQDDDKRFVLKAVLETKEDKSLRMAATAAGLACFGARSENVTRPYTFPHLEALVRML